MGKYIDEEDQEVTITKPMNPKGPSKCRIISNHMKKQRSTSQPWSEVRLVSYNDKIKRIVRQISEDAMQNPTYAMIEQLKAMQAKKFCHHLIRLQEGKGLWQNEGIDQALSLKALPRNHWNEECLYKSMKGETADYDEVPVQVL